MSGDKRMKNATVYRERNSAEGLYSRYKVTISALNDLMKDAALVKHRRTLDEVAKAMKRALENDQKWSADCRALQQELDSNESRVKIALELSERDKSVISSLQKELKTAQNRIKELELKIKNDLKQSDVDERGEDTERKNYARKANIEETDEDEKKREAKKKIDYEIILEEMTENQDKLLNEIESIKLQVFELEEEKTNKDKYIEELTNSLNLKSDQLDNVAKEYIKLKKTLSEIKSSNNANSQRDSNKSNKSDAEDKEMKLEGIIQNQKQKLHEINKRDQISLEKVKHLIRKNKILNKQLQTIKNQNNLMKLEIAEQKKLLDLLSHQFCKLEEKDKKQSLTITELEKIRNKYIDMVGNLEQKIHALRKKSKI